MRIGFILLFLGAVSFHAAHAQKSKKKRNHREKKLPQQEVLATTTVSELSQQEFPLFIEQSVHCEDNLYQQIEFPLVEGNVAAIEEQLLPRKEVKLDTCTANSYIMIETADGTPVRLNTKWLLSADYFSTWDTRNVDPYEFSLKNFTDSIPITLYGGDNAWSPPLKNTKINSKFGMRRWRWHHGADLDLEIGDSVYAAFDGVVRIARYNYGGYGYYVMLRHENGLETLYGHLSTILANVGQEVKAGELIGLGGNTGRSTGPHLHYEVRYKGHAFDPTRLYDFTTDTLLTDSFVLTSDFYQVQIERSNSQYHRIKGGDTLSGLAVRYGTSINRICQLNGISKKTTLRIGRSLRVR